MDDYIIVNGDKYPAQVSRTSDRQNHYVSISVEMEYEQAKSVFVPNARLTIDYGEDQTELPDYRILYQLIDKMDGTIQVIYKRLTDTEKLIELHYGSVNSVSGSTTLNDGSSTMADQFKDMYQHNLISIGAVRQAVMDGLLTEEDYKKITGEDY